MVNYRTENNPQIYSTGFFPFPYIQFLHILEQIALHTFGRELSHPKQAKKFHTSEQGPVLRIFEGQIWAPIYVGDKLPQNLSF